MQWIQLDVHLVLLFYYPVGLILVVEGFTLNVANVLEIENFKIVCGKRVLPALISLFCVPDVLNMSFY